ncbi:Glutathione synthetase [Caenorhabditis elegans]|uniref:Glutathione synthetase n=1 Tax=Caenorhabditis elegans TaxID=6239 RepID=Q21549_CAEEL|nr:Glutathione synthetase [Caenorhabditis elegans]CAB01655.1 Glutathione synthetase [Caenorhabditis elegans]|eukprot:NP_496011.1 Glutathione synthetase [Caenorhabditis elegans]
MAQKDDRILLLNAPRLPLEDDKLNELTADLHDWAHANGLVMRLSTDKLSSEVCQTTPLTLLPSPFPKNVFEEAVHIQNLFASLYHFIAYEFDFLIDIHKNVVKTDDFTRNMVEILKKVKAQGLKQPVTLAIQRSDYMCHKDQYSAEYGLKQIEINNIASSMGAHALRLTEWHIRVLKALNISDDVIQRAIPENKPIPMIAEALFKAWSHFSNPAAVVLVVVENVNQNQIDQRHVEYELEKLGVPMTCIIRRNLTQCYEQLSLNDRSDLMIDGRQVAIVYFRAGYSPDHYPSTKEWEARERMELSTAIKTPWIGLQVANTKKTQQVLSEDGVLERFIGKPREARDIRASFAGMWALENTDEVTMKVVAGAQKHPEAFVLKPQTEGGAALHTGDEMVQMLRELPEEERGAFILMEKLKPMIIENYLVLAKKPITFAKAVSELGVYGYAFGRKDAPELKTAGHLLRTKPESTAMGGVAAGHAVVDTPFLYEFI